MCELFGNVLFGAVLEPSLVWIHDTIMKYQVS